MNPLLLLKDELEFELACRGVYNITNCPSMRKILKEIFTQEASGTCSIKLKAPKSCLENPLAEIQLCESKCQTLGASLEEIKDSPDLVILNRVEARLTHLNNRLGFITPSDQSLVERHTIVCDTVRCLFEILNSAREAKYAEKDDAISDRDREILQQSLGEEAMKLINKIEPKDIEENQVADKNASTEQFFEPGSSMTRYAVNPPLQAQRNTLLRTSTFDHETHLRKLVPIKDWGLKYTGKGDMSVNAFLERVEELKDARNANNEDLWRYAIDLFEGDALIWFRANRSETSNWENVVRNLLMTFQKPYYQDELLEEIKKRTQGRNENVTIYLAVMQNMFNRLPEKVTEQQKLAILLKNIQPYFQQAVCRDIFTSVAELGKVLVILERTKFNCDNFTEPLHTSNALEPDLAYREVHAEVNAIYKPTSKPPEGPAIMARKCWNCRTPGHTFRDCNLPRQRLFCFRCGKFGETTSRCTCGRQGNEASEAVISAERPSQ